VFAVALFVIYLCLVVFPPVSQLSGDLCEPDYGVMKIMKNHPSTVYTHHRNLMVSLCIFLWVLFVDAPELAIFLRIGLIPRFHTVYQGQRTIIIIILYRVQIPCNYYEQLVLKYLVSTQRFIIIIIIIIIQLKYLPIKQILLIMFW